MICLKILHGYKIVEYTGWTRVAEISDSGKSSLSLDNEKRLLYFFSNDNQEIEWMRKLLKYKCLLFVNKFLSTNSVWLQQPSKFFKQNAYFTITC